MVPLSARSRREHLREQVVGININLSKKTDVVLYRYVQISLCQYLGCVSVSSNGTKTKVAVPLRRNDFSGCGNGIDTGHGRKFRYEIKKHIAVGKAISFQMTVLCNLIPDLFFHVFFLKLFSLQNYR